MSIFTKEQLKTHIHKIHNLIRNSGAGYGLDAFKIFNFFYGMKVLEPYWKQFKLKSMKFSKLVEISRKTLGNDTEIEILIELFENSKEMMGCYYELNRNEYLKNIVVSKINEGLKSNFYKQIILEIDKIPTINNKQNTDIINDKFDVDIKGKTYEYFIGRDTVAISDLGSYFTDRHITNFILNIVEPELLDDKLPSYIDPFGGSGGFTISFINYIKNKYSNVKWNTIENIRHYDMSEVVVKSCALEILALTGIIPDMESSFQICNSFKQDFGGIKYSYILSNPPYGNSGSINSESESSKLINELKKRYYVLEEIDDKKNYKWKEKWAKEQYEELRNQQKKEIIEIESQQVNWETCGKRIRDFCLKYDEEIEKKYNSSELIKNFKISEKCNDKEACSLIMFMELLEKKGKCAVVLKEGLLFDNKYSSIRKCLVDNYKITHIISVPQDAFENTTTKTSVVIFKNSGQTKKIKFSELIVEKELNDVFETVEKDGVISLELITQKNQIIKVSDELKSYATYDDISKLTIKELGKTKKEVWNYSLNWKDYIKDDTFCPEGYTLTKMKDLIEYKKKSKRQASYANEEGLYRFYTSSDTIKKCIECDYISNELLLIFGTGGKGSLFIDNNFSCSGDNFVCEINEKLTKEHIWYIYQYIKSNWNQFIFKMFNGSTLGHLNKTRLNNLLIPIPNDINLLKPILKNLSKAHKKILDLNELIPEKEKEICELMKDLTENGEEGKDWDEYKLGEYVNIDKNIKKYETSFGNVKGKYNFHTGSEKNYLYCDKYDIHEGIIINKTNGSGICNLKYDKKFSVAKQTFILTGSNIKYVFYYLKIDINILEHGYDGACHKNLSSSYLNKIKIKVLKEKNILKSNLTNKFDEVDKLKEELELTKKTYQEEINKFTEPFKINEK
jgi:type I restriction-modification system DNA methylase subunit